MTYNNSKGKSYRYIIALIIQLFHKTYSLFPYMGYHIGFRTFL